VNRASSLGALAEQDPSNPVLLCDLLDELLAAGLVDEASNRLDKVPASTRHSPGVRFREARCALLRNDCNAVVALLAPLLTEMQDVPAGIVHDLAYAQLLQGKLDEALQTLTHAQFDGDDAVALALLKARILHRQQQHQAAIDALAGIHTGTRLPEVQGLRALLLLDLGETERAALEADRALAADPDQHEAGIVRGTVSLWSRDLEVSFAAFQQVLARHPESGRAWLGLGQNRMLHGDVVAARALLERAVQQMPDHIGTWHALAWCQLLQGDLSGTKHSFDRAFALDRTFGETHGGFALVHALRGERKEAEESIKRASRLDPRGRSARYAQSVLLLDDGRVDEARKIIDEIVARTPGAGVVSADFIFKLREIVRPRS
jgi:tetratricopeptide (TPR) repeat protein